MVDNTPRLEMATRHIGNGDQDDKMRCDVALRDLGLEQRQGQAK